MRITVGHILLCLVTVAQAADNSLNRDLPERPARSEHHNLGVAPGSGVPKHRSSKATQKSTITSQSEAQLLELFARPKVEHKSDIINVRFLLDGDSDSDDKEKERKSDPALPYDIGIRIELDLIFQQYRKDELQIERPFRLKYQNELGFVLKVEKNEHHVYFWGEGVGDGCIKDRGFDSCFLGIADEPDKDGHLATIEIPSEQPDSKGNSDKMWICPLDVRLAVRDCLVNGPGARWPPRYKMAAQDAYLGQPST
ncbi:hypothetical protein F5878DRAFT_661837 [Lentinula raphanica]|uniref:Uncharacterized protein n=1 Tax=Lentinula raphanica TaxID=153919 RepID=A0AA38P7E8_9AGAR|nr:hypothetical protein F5880DRAFT_1501749 [Lentinula raphanica]KAJ3837712.1 hypothetical protein F5878DRAFT_661837 [Lentinula raphanica]